MDIPDTPGESGQPDSVNRTDFQINLWRVVSALWCPYLYDFSGFFAMQITFKLFASLMAYLPSGAERNQAALEVGHGTTPNQLIERYSVPKSEVHLVLLNGIYLDEDARDEPMNDGDTLAIWPPVAGG